ncbi:glutamine synthetase family protein [Pseudonocardia broussonetiae]|uniref:Glutamine synthetase n=1 Tax=Pseudonocardia broussonetiae TaxID=2736640 RepID=A0A6M6JN61_9PSEU|nr:glutamine synthetase family protein [Pseudonocardia broussonetiae]QJY47751.1 glutamine synthetase [Pseudonocardia broussonetiae]
MSAEILAAAGLAEDEIHTVVVATPDLQGRLVGRRVPVEGFARVVEEGVDVCTCVFAWDLTQSLELVEANVFTLCGLHNGIPDFTLLPDLTTLRRAAWLDGIAFCFADAVDKATREPLPISPRQILKQQIERLGAVGLRALTGTELEFYLFLNAPRDLRRAGFRGLEPTTLVPSDFMIHEGNLHEPFFRALRRDLRDSRIEVEAAQSEWGSGQWEMTFRYGEPLEMADRHALYKLAVRDSAAAAGMSATFMAKPLNQGQPGSSCHVHVSMVDLDGRPTFWDPAEEHGIAGTMAQAIGGVLEHAPDLMAWYVPTVNAYRRVNSGDVAGWGSTWGLDNRTTSVRVVGRHSHDLRFEFRLPGADTNPYLTLAGLLASARDGILGKTAPPPMTTGNGYAAPVDPAFPVDLGQAAARLRGSAFVADTVGEDQRDHMAVLAEHEWRAFMAHTGDWDLDRYFDRI